MHAIARQRYWRGASQMAWLGVAMLCTLTLAACHRTPAEQQIRAAISAATMGARNNDTHAVLDILTDDFVGNDGDLDRAGLQRLLAVRALRQDRTGVLVGPIGFTRSGDRIVAKFHLVLTGGQPGDLLPDDSAVYALTTAWRRDGGHWRCYRADWTSAAD